MLKFPEDFRRIFSRFEKPDVMFIGFLHFALIVEAFRSVNMSWFVFARRYHGHIISR
jgi:hypothetical protein